MRKKIQLQYSKVGVFRFKFRMGNRRLFREGGAAEGGAAASRRRRRLSNAESRCAAASCHPHSSLECRSLIVVSEVIENFLVPDFAETSFIISL